MQTTVSPEQDWAADSCGNVTATHGRSSGWAEAQWLVAHFLMPSVSIAGVIGNALTIVVLTRKWMKSSTNRYLTALAVFDLLYLALVFSLRITMPPSIYWFYLYVKHMVDTCSNVAVWLTLTFTVERYVCVCHPLRGRRFCTPRQAAYCIVGVALAAAVVTSPGYFEFEAVVRKCNARDWVRSTFGMSAGYKQVYIYINMTCFTFMPLTLLLVFNVLLVRSVARASRQRRMMSAGDVSGISRRQQQHEQIRITIMLIAVVFVFLVCQLPQAVLNLINHAPNTRPVYMRFLRTVANLLVMFNAAVNFALYSAFSGKFRKTFAILVCRRHDYVTEQTHTQQTVVIGHQQALQQQHLLDRTQGNGAEPIVMERRSTRTLRP